MPDSQELADQAAEFDEKAERARQAGDTELAAAYALDAHTHRQAAQNR